MAIDLDIDVGGTGYVVMGIGVNFVAVAAVIVACHHHGTFWHHQSHDG